MSFEKKTILVVDDCAAFRDSFRKLLKNLPFSGEIFEAEDGASAIQMVQECVPDTLLTQLGLFPPDNTPVEDWDLY